MVIPRDLDDHEGIETLDDFRVYLELLRADFVAGGPPEAYDGGDSRWASWNVGQYLDSFGAWIENWYLRDPDAPRPEPTWATFAMFLNTAAIYE